ncbi:glycosyltransferase [Ochrobactrum sp. CM-21-5]|nr:glycosyltransferase [Ochrobactrum sp. CM-21-5]MBC2884669.1 glycosyltransferase [Ochrobactrum sp. CM-21-5]
MKKIAFVANDLSNLIHHRNHLLQTVVDARGYVVVLAGGEKNNRDTFFEFQHVRIERFSFHWSDITLFLRVLRFVLVRRPDVIHLINLKPYFYGGAAARIAKLLGWDGKVVVTVPGLGRLFAAVGHGGIKPKLTRAIVQYFLRKSMKGAVVTFETASDRDFWVAHRFVLPAAAVVTSGAGIDFSLFQISNIEKSKETLSVLYAGRLLKSKGLDVVLAAAEKNDNENIRISVAGYKESDPDAVSFEELSHNSKINFLGGVENMGRLFARVDVVVLPSRYNEGIPRVLIEAAACGCVPIATKFPGSEAIIKEGETGFFLHGNDKLAQADELNQLLQKLQREPEKVKKVGMEASKFVRSNGFSSDDIAYIFRKIYNV